MCDTMCSVQSGRTLFAKNSDRPVAEVQLIEAFDRRASGGRLHTQYLEIDDLGAAAVLGARPDWLWGFEHGLNEHGVAIGNEKVWTTDDAATAPPALIGMDLVRLGLERATTADQAVEVITELLATHGQGGIADAIDDEAYFSSFLLADPHGAWVLETSGRRWAARRVTGGAAISNRISLSTDWQRASADLTEGGDWDRVRDPNAWTGLADIRLAVTRPTVESNPALSARDLARVLRDHGPHHGVPDPQIEADGTGITVCMHVRDYQCTTSSIIAELTADAPSRLWVAMGSPCVSVYLPGFGTAALPEALADPATFARFAALRERVEVTPWAQAAANETLGEIRAVLDPIEDELWSEADDLVDQRDRWAAFVADGWRRVEDGLTKLGV